jgi:hypothetical protein
MQAMNLFVTITFEPKSRAGNLTVDERPSCHEIGVQIDFGREGSRSYDCLTAKIDQHDQLP